MGTFPAFSVAFPVTRSRPKASRYVDRHNRVVGQPFHDLLALAPTRLVPYLFVHTPAVHVPRASSIQQHDELAGDTNTYRTRQRPSPRVRRTAHAPVAPRRGELLALRVHVSRERDSHSGIAGYTSSTGHGNNVRIMKRNAEPAAICRVKSTPVYSFAVGKSGARWKKMMSNPK